MAYGSPNHRSGVVVHFSENLNIDLRDLNTLGTSDANIIFCDFLFYFIRSTCQFTFLSYSDDRLSLWALAATLAGTFCYYELQIVFKGFG